MENTYTLKITPRATTAPDTWAAAATDATDHLLIQGVTVNERFEDSDWEFGLAVIGDCRLRLVAPNGEYFGVSDSRSIFAQTGREKAFVELGDGLFFGIGRERGTDDDHRQGLVDLQAVSVSGILRDIQTPASALVANIRAFDSLTEMLLTADDALPDAFSPFDSPDILLNHPLFDAMRIANPGAISNRSIFDVVALLLSANDAAIRVDRTKTSVVSRGISAGLGHQTITDAGEFFQTAKLSEGYERLYTAIRADTGEEARPEVFRGSATAASDYGGRELSLDLSFLGNFARAGEVLEYLLPRLSTPTREVRAEVRREIADQLGLFSRVTIAAVASTGGLPGDITFGKSEFPVDLIRPLYGEFYVAEINRNLGRGTANIRLREAAVGS